MSSLSRQARQRNGVRESDRPRWDGLGTAFPSQLEPIPGLDGDFGEVHFNWTLIYANEVRLSTFCSHLRLTSSVDTRTRPRATPTSGSALCRPWSSLALTVSAFERDTAR